MSFPKESLKIDTDVKISSPALDNILEQEECIRQLLEPSSAVVTMLKRESQMLRMIESPSALIAITEQQKQLLPTIMSPMLENITAQQNLMAEHGLAFSKSIAASINFPQLNMLSESIAKTASISLQKHTYDLANSMGRALETCIPKYDVMANSLSNALEACMPKFDAIGNMALRLADSIPHIDSAISSITHQTLGAMDNLTSSLQSSVSALLGSLTDIKLPNFDHLASSLNFITDFEVKNDLLKSFGWYLISELPEEIVDTIYERREEITQEEVDTLIIQHFRNNKYQALKNIVNSWTSLPYFDSRQVIFHEAQVCHSRRSYNASTTLISLHYEGVVTDFVRGRINPPTYRVEKALKCINDLTNDLSMDAMTLRDWMVCSYVLECIDKAFTTNFSPADPDSCPNSSRHKIAHGHAIAKENEANSLRRFLFMNELYKLFCCLENECELIS